jgi:hypothetical protein
MDQGRVIQEIYHWLRADLSCECFTVKCDHVTEAKEELALFIGSKTQGQGRGCRIAQVDILVCNELTKRVELIVEVDPNCAPKVLMGNLMSVLLADNYVPSNSFSSYAITNTLVIFLTLLDCRQGSQKVSQFKLIEQTMRHKLALTELGVKDVILCHGVTEDEAIEAFQKAIRDHFGDTTKEMLNGLVAPVEIKKNSPPLGAEEVSAEA